MHRKAFFIWTKLNNKFDLFVSVRLKRANGDMFSKIKSQYGLYQIISKPNDLNYVFHVKCIAVLLLYAIYYNMSYSIYKRKVWNQKKHDDWKLWFRFWFWLNTRLWIFTYYIISLFASQRCADQTPYLRDLRNLGLGEYTQKQKNR